MLAHRLPSACALGALLTLAAAGAGCVGATAEEHVERGNAYVTEGRDLEAIIEFRNAVEKDSQNGEAHYQLGLAYERTRDYGKAAQEFVLAAELMPRAVDPQIKSATMFLLSRQFDLARVIAERALRNDPSNVVAQVLHANAMAGLKRTGSALAAIQRAISLDPTRGETYTELALFQLANGSPEQAEENLKRAVEALPDSAQAHLTLGSFYWAQGRMEEAEAALKRSVEVEPSNFIGSRALATFYLGVNRAEDAEAHLKRIAETTGAVQAKLALADYYIALGRDVEAEAVLSTAAADPAGFPDARSRIAAIRYAAGGQSEAHDILDDAIAQHPQASRPLMTKAQFRLVERQADDAIALLRQAINRDQTSVPAHFSLAQAYAARQQPELAAQEFNEVLRLEPQSMPAKMELARLYLATGDPDVAIDFAQQVLRGRPDSLDAAFIVAKAHATKGQISRALDTLAPHQEQVAERADVLAFVGALNHAIGEADTALEFFERGMKAEPDSVEPVEGLVAMHIRMGNMSAARDVALERLQQSPHDSRFLVVAARAWTASNDLEQAERTLRDAVAADPTNTVAYEMLGQIYASQQRLEQALREYQSLIERDPRSVSANTMVGYLLQALDRDDEARRAYEQALEIDPRTPIAAANLAWLYAENNQNLDIALQLAQVAKEELPEHPDVNDTLAWIYYRKDLPEMALPAQLLAIEKDPVNATYQYHLGLIHMKTGDIELARAALQKALDLNPKFEGASDAAQALRLLGY
ncbi:MAG: tetratricopeptide repeat protein [Acidimicrobiia bacterium]|nr:tetratricopeptide repeat protein [Acidimicrobiia bacterium]